MIAHPRTAMRRVSAKCVFDRTLTALGLLVLSPLFAALSLLVWWYDGRPVFFRQSRVGRLGRDFTLYKFRTMAVKPDAGAGAFEPGDASRVTRVGRFLRATKLDELPQLFNVLRGEMSLVGPRPEVRKWVEASPQRWRGVHSVLPGITDPASIAYRDEERVLAAASDPDEEYRNVVLPHKLDLYEQYVKDRTFAGDLSILLETFSAVVGTRTTDTPRNEGDIDDGDYDEDGCAGGSAGEDPVCTSGLRR